MTSSEICFVHVPIKAVMKFQQTIISHVPVVTEAARPSLSLRSYCKMATMIKVHLNSKGPKQ
jgi:hypothetical protein